MSSFILNSLYVIGITIALFLFMRQINLWYFKINESINNQKITNDLLARILDKIDKKEPEKDNSNILSQYRDRNPLI